jgi:hypothetical protein
MSEDTTFIVLGISCLAAAAGVCLALAALLR